MDMTVRAWVDSCQDCGSRKFKPAAVVPPLRPIRVGEVNDRWALDLQGPFPRSHFPTNESAVRRTHQAAERLESSHAHNRLPKDSWEYVAVFTEYVTRFAVTVTLKTRTAAEIAQVFLERVVFVFGPCR